MARVVWKGAIAFGLVHVPIVLHPGARRADLDFDWIDHRDMAPVGYLRINKRTGKPIASEDIVKGYQYEKGEYVLMNDEDFRQANPVATQTVEIECFVKAAELPPYYFDTPYYMVPDKRGEKGYALLRETLRRTHLVGIANVVLHTKQHLAAVIVVGDILMLNTMRYADEIVSQEDLSVPPSSLSDAGVSERETDMALRLVEDMTEKWQPERFRDAYREDLLARIESRIEAGQTHTLTVAAKAGEPRHSAKVIDLMSMLKQSIDSRAPKKSRPRAAPKATQADPAPSAKSARKTASGISVKTAGKTASKASSNGERKASTPATAARPPKKTPRKSAGPRQAGPRKTAPRKTASRRAA